MSYNKALLSEKRKQFIKSLSEVIDVLNDVATNGGGSDTFTDSNGNEIRLGIDIQNGKAIINLDLRQQDSNISIEIAEPYEKMIKELEKGHFLNVCCKKK